MTEKEMTEKQTKEKLGALVRAHLPKKRKVDACTELLYRLLQANASDPKSAISTTKLSGDMKGARGHLIDMAHVGLVKKRSNEPLRFFLDARDPINPSYPKGSAEIRSVREANIAELLRHIADNTEVTRIALSSTTVSDISELTALIQNDDGAFNKVIDAIAAAGLRDEEYEYGTMGWRTGCLFWYITDATSGIA